MADQIGVFTPEQARELWQDYQTRKQLQPQLQHNYPRRRDIDEPSPHRVFVRNLSGSEAPPFACLEIVGTASIGDRLVITVRQPTSTCNEFLFNSQFAIEPGGYGWAYAWGLVRMLGVAGSYEACKRYKPVANAWSIAEGPGPFLVYGNDFTQLGVCIGRIIGDKCQAKWIKFRYMPGSEGPVEVTEFYDGPDPSECGDVDVDYPLGQPLCECDVIAFWDPNTLKYQAIATEAAMMGESENRTVVLSVAGQPCGITVGTMDLRVFPNSCNPSVDEADVTLGDEVGVILTLGSESCGTINYAYTTIRAFLCEYPVEFDSFAINFDGVEFVTGIEFGAPACTEEAIYTWNLGTTSWDLTTPCPNGCESTPPAIPVSPPSTAITQAQPCNDSINAQCGLNVTLNGICSSPGNATTEHAALPLEAVEVVYDVVDNTSEINIYKKTVYVCNWEPANDGTPIPIDDCPT